MKFSSELENLSFENLLKVKQEIGSKTFDSLYKKEAEKETEEPSSSSSDDSEPEKEKRTRKTIEKRKDKNMPMEITSKKPVTRKRNIVQVPSKPVNDFLILAGI